MRPESAFGLDDLILLLDCVDHGLILLDSDWRLSWCSDAASRIVGAGGAAAVGRPIADLLRIEDPHSGVEGIRTQVRASGSWKGEVVHRTGDGLKWAELSVFALHGPGREGMNLCLVRDSTERNLGEQELRDQGRKYRLLADNARDVIWTADLGLNFTYISPSIERLRGFTPEEAVRQSVAETLTPSSLERATQVFSEELALELSPGADPHRMRVLELEERRRDGSVVSTELTLSFLRNDKLEPIGVLGVTRDVTERNRAMEALRRNEERYRITAEQTGQVFFDWDLASGQIEWAGAGEDVTGRLRRTGPTVTHSEWETWIHPDDVERVRTLLRKAMSEPGGYDTEYRLRRADGSYCVVEVHGIFLRDRESTPVRMLGTMRDISKRKRIDEALHESQRAMTSLITNLPGVVYRCHNDRDWTMEYLSPACEALTGYPSEALLGNRALSFNDLIDESHREKVWQEWQIALREHGVYRGEYQIRRADGELRWVREQGSGVYSESGEVLALEGFITDITARKLAEDARQKAEKERGSLEEQLRQAQKMEAIGHLAGGVAHDFNNILTSINGFTELVMSEVGTADPIYLDLLEVKKASDRASSLTSQLLAFSRKQLIAPKLLDLNELVLQSTRMIQRIIGEQVQLVFTAGADVGRIKADPGQLDQILVNLAVNARDALAGGGTVRLETARVVLDEERSRQFVGSLPGAYAILEVHDDGCGMTRELQDHIFEPFFTTKGMGKGTGLGLSTVYGIVHQNGGFIHVESTPGQGTTFRVFLPSAKEAVEASARARSSPVPHGRAVILLAEDEEGVRRVTQRMLESHGYTVLVASDGIEAAAISDRFAGVIDLLLTDVIMPKLDGKQLHARLQLRRPSLKVLFVSGYAENAISHQGVLDEGIPFLQKPFSTEALIRRVTEVLES